MSSVESSRSVRPGSASQSSEERDILRGFGPNPEGLRDLPLLTIQPSTVIKTTLLRAKVSDGDLSEGEAHRLCRASLQRAEAEEMFARKRIQEIRTLHLTDTDQAAPPTVILAGSIAMTVAQAVEDVLTAEKELVDMQVAECIAHLQILRKIQEDVASCRAAATDQVAYVRLVLQGFGITDSDLQQLELPPMPPR